MKGRFGRRGLMPIAAVLCALLGGCASTVSESPASRSATTSVAGPTTPNGLAAAIQIDNVMTHLRALQTIADRHDGNRASGTAGYDASVDYVAGKLKDAGFTVTTPTFDYPRFDAGPVRLTADGQAVDARIAQYSAGTGDTPVTGPPVTAGDLGCSTTDYPPATRGAIAVATRGTCQFVIKARAAADAGATALIIVNNENGPLDGATLGLDNGVPIPVIGVTTADGDRLRSAASVSLAVQAQTRQITSRNVIAQTRTGDPDHVLLTGAHLDSVEAGPGINDNGSGTAAVLETALRLGSAPQTRRTIRFAFWGGEEDGLVGSSKYVESLDAGARTTIDLYLNFDMLGSPNGGYFVYDGDNSDKVGAGPGPRGSAEIEQTFLRYFGNRRITAQGSDFDGRSDYGPFIEIGVPSGGVDTGAEAQKSAAQAQLWGGQAGVAFDPNYHRAGDTVANINPALLATTAPAVAYSVATYASSNLG
ncbi:M28 family metallopeptidase [Gordonia sp. CPCC 205515]|uniref:M28 family metallopeptidase n=1 Tax=Gordonia sp. CPCC 205515 TaxID=3140791 RepID=UPI003AF38C8F